MHQQLFHTEFDPETRIWSGLAVRPLYNPNASVADVLFASLLARPNHIAQISDTDGSRLTNGEMYQFAVRTAVNLRRVENVRKGDVVSFVVRNHRLVGSLILGCIALAAPVNTLDTDFRIDEIVHMLNMTAPKVIFCDADLVDTLREALRYVGAIGEVALYTVDKRVADVKSADDLIEPSAEANEQRNPTDVGDGTRHPVAIMCSSGTTGKSKGVLLSHALALHQMVVFCEVNSEDVFLTFSSLYWVTGMINLLGGTLYGLTRIITTAKFDPELMLEIIKRYSVTSTITPPFSLSKLLQSPNTTVESLRTVRTYVCGGCSVPNELVQRINQLLPSPLRITYGLSEIAGSVSMNPADAPVAGSVGRLRTGVHIKLRRIVTDDGSADSAVDATDIQQQLCTIGEDGEVCIRFDDLPFLGYWSNEAANLAAFDADGWLITGDVGHFDAEGNLYLVDRLKDMLHYLGTDISPSELENVVMEKVAGVAEVCVVGVPDEHGSDLATAVVVRKQTEAGAAMQAEDIEAAVLENFRDAKKLRGGVCFVERLPLTPSGKVVRRRVQDLVLQMKKVLAM